MDHIYNYFSDTFHFEDKNYLFYGSISALPVELNFNHGQTNDMIDVRFRYRQLELGNTAPSELIHFYIIVDSLGNWVMGKYENSRFIRLSNPVHLWLIDVVRKSYKEAQKDADDLRKQPPFLEL